MQKIEIGYLKKQDIVLYKALMDSCFGGSNDISSYETYDENSTQYKIIVAKFEDQIVGSLTCYHIDLFTFSFQPSIEIFNVGVLASFRGQKIGRRLFEYAIEYAKLNHYQSMFLTCFEGARAAHHLYEAVGFEKVDSRKYQLLLESD